MAWKIISNEEAFQAALSRLEEVFDCKKGDEHFDEAELLVMLIHKYEQENEPAFINPDPIEGLKIWLKLKAAKARFLKYWIKKSTEKNATRTFSTTDQNNKFTNRQKK